MHIKAYEYIDIVLYINKHLLNISLAIFGTKNIKKMVGLKVELFNNFNIFGSFLHKGMYQFVSAQNKKCIFIATNMLLQHNF